MDLGKDTEMLSNETITLYDSLNFKLKNADYSTSLQNRRRTYKGQMLLNTEEQEADLTSWESSNSWVGLIPSSHCEQFTFG